MVSRNPHELQSRNDIWRSFGLKELFERTKSVLYPNRHNNVEEHRRSEPNSSAKEVQLRKIHQNAQLLGIFISLDAHSRVDTQIRVSLKKLLKSYTAFTGTDESAVTEMRNISILSLLSQPEQAIVQEWLSKRSIRMDDLFSRTLGEMVDFLAQKNLDGSLKTSGNSPNVTNVDPYTFKEKTTQLLFKNYSDEVINEVVSPESLRDLYSRVCASAYRL